MAIIQPTGTETTASIDHAHLHRAVGVDESAPDESIVVAASGNVGIGTASPLQPLHVTGGTVYAEGTSAAGTTGFQTDNHHIFENESNRLQIETSNAAYGLILNSAHGADVYTNALTDYSTTSTIVGWSSFTTKEILVKKLGKTVHVWFRLVGTSNSATTTFTVPYAASSAISFWRNLGYAADDDGTAVAGQINIAGGASLVTLYPIVATSAWTASGGKSVSGLLVYEAA